MKTQLVPQQRMRLIRRWWMLPWAASTRLSSRPVVAALLMMTILQITASGAVQRQAISRGLPPAALAAKAAIGTALPSELDIAFALPLRNRQALDVLLHDLYDPTSPNYRKYLTPDQFAAQFGPSKSDYDAVVQFAKTNGLTIVKTHSNRTVLVARGSVGNIEKMLHVKMRMYQHPSEPRVFYAPDTTPTVDLKVPLAGIWGLDDYHRARPGSGIMSESHSPGTQAGSGSGANGSYRGDDLRPAYVPGTSLTGSGQVIGLFELNGYYTNDIVTYENQSGISPLVPLVNVPVDGFSGAPDTNKISVGEVSLDIEVAIAMAPGVSKVLVYEATNNGAHVLSMLDQIATDNQAKEISCSWGIFNEAGGDSVYLQMAAQGQSFFQSAGDFDAFYAGIGQWADNPYVTICGGTALNTTAPRGAYVSESVWNNNNGTNGTGGGISGPSFGNYSIPLWQQGINMTFNQGSTAMRNVPDVSMLASNTCVIYFNGLTGRFWGTSIAAPMWAGFTALVNQQAADNGLPPVGFLNPALYQIAKSPAYAACFHDIIQGDNTSDASPTKYYATPGYDLCTGLGSPNGTNLINALTFYGGYSSGTWVDYNYSGISQLGTYNSPYTSLTQAVSTVSPGGEVWFRTSGSNRETMTISKPMTIHAFDGPVTIGQ